MMKTQPGCLSVPLSLTLLTEKYTKMLLQITFSSSMATKAKPNRRNIASQTNSLSKGVAVVLPTTDCLLLEENVENTSTLASKSEIWLQMKKVRFKSLRLLSSFSENLCFFAVIRFYLVESTEFDSLCVWKQRVLFVVMAIPQSLHFSQSQLTSYTSICASDRQLSHYLYRSTAVWES